ncbi:MAG: cysteine--tRNA ligase [Alphaproteobacteria bacterium]
MLKIFDTATREKVEFEPINSDEVKMYVCGPTVYDYIHIGNGRPVVVFDVLYRLLKTMYPSVKYVRNITDVDDKINQRAMENNETIGELTARTEKQFVDDYTALHTLSPDAQPRATEHIAEMIEIINTLIDKGHAYASENHVLFRVKSWDEYGKFANKDYDEQVQGARVEIADYKEDPADFVLWKPSNENEPGWDSPWGYGRPGWHIECSAMSKKHLGEYFDIHGGGLDLIFPHHQNEIAQSCCSNETGKFAKYWMHNGFLMSEGEKMSKSLGNFYTINELLKEFSGNAIRFVLLSTHYRKPLDFTKDKLAEADKLISKLSSLINSHNDIETIDCDINEFTSALCDDLNTPLAISVMWEYFNNLKSEPNAINKSKLLKAFDLLGIDTTAIETVEIPTEVVELAENRKNAKAEKDFAKADEIRDKIKSLGYEVKDTADGFEINKI